MHPQSTQTLVKVKSVGISFESLKCLGLYYPAFRKAWFGLHTEDFLSCGFMGFFETASTAPKTAEPKCTGIFLCLSSVYPLKLAWTELQIISMWVRPFNREEDPEKLGALPCYLSELHGGQRSLAFIASTHLFLEKAKK